VGRYGLLIGDTGELKPVSLAHCRISFVRFGFHFRIVPDSAQPEREILGAAAIPATLWPTHRKAGYSTPTVDAARRARLDSQRSIVQFGSALLSSLRPDSLTLV
jgi:hypothetical protein